VTGGSHLEALDPVRRTVEPDVPRRPRIDDSDGTIGGRIADDHGGIGGVLHQPAPVQPAAGEATGGHPPAADAELEDLAGLPHQVAAAREEQRQRHRVLDRRADRREQRSRVPSPSVPVVDPHPDLPTGQVREADVDVDPARADLEPSRLDRRLAPLPSSPPTWASAVSRVRPGCR
jgi:hypothetical protein